MFRLGVRAVMVGAEFRIDTGLEATAFPVLVPSEGSRLRATHRLLRLRQREA